MKKYLIFIFAIIANFVFSQSENGIRVITAKCAIAQTGSGTGYWQVLVTNYNDPGGQQDASGVLVGDYIQFSDSGNPYALEITEIVGSPSGNSGTFKVSNVGVVGISSVPTTNNASLSSRTPNFGLVPRVANISDNDDQLQMEWTMYKIDALLATDAGFFSTSDTLVFSPSGKTPVNGDFALHTLNGCIYEKKNGFWNQRTGKNAQWVTEANRKVIAYPALGNLVLNMNQAARFYVSCVGDLTVMSPSNLANQKAGDIFSLEVNNNTPDSITVTFNNFVIKDFNHNIIPIQWVYAGGTKIFTFKVVKSGELTLLVSMDDLRGASGKSEFYLPTITKNLSSDTIVTVYNHFYQKEDNTVILDGRVLVNNASSTLTSSFRVGFPIGITSNFDNTYNDAVGVVKVKREGFPATVYGGDVYADTVNDRVTISYDTDGSTSTRQIITYVLAFKIK